MSEWYIEFALLNFCGVDLEMVVGSLFLTKNNDLEYKCVCVYICVYVTL